MEKEWWQAVVVDGRVISKGKAGPYVLELVKKGILREGWNKDPFVDGVKLLLIAVEKVEES